MAKKQSTNDQAALLKALQETEGPAADDASEQGDDDDSVEREDTPPEEASETQPKDTVAMKRSGKQKRSSKTTAPPPTTPGSKSSSAGSSRRLVWILIVVIIAMVGAAGAGLALFGTKSPSNSATVTNADASALVPRRIDGVLDNPEEQNRYPVAVMVENHPAARPQSGLHKANVVFEALAEGGITRFLAVYTLNDAVKEIGPVRSARPYYIDWARGFNALYVHIGGSQKALSRITQTNARDLNQFFNSQYFYRDSSREVASEHTLYASKRLMQLALLDTDAPKVGSFDTWKFKADAPANTRPASQHVTINFSTFSYKVDYEYDPVTNTYARAQAEQPHVDRASDQIRVKNVIVITVKRRLEQPADGLGRLEMDTVGEGLARVFLDGQETSGTWKKASPQDQIKFYNTSGTEIELNAGNTWIEVVPPEQEVTVR